ncbi:MAG: AAA family ATPase [Solirubrobacteraceae bacterium MAG38_C4-C5]|nr:AAA family ATPase [Candidatus Siliceabacter maunaloa]
MGAERKKKRRRTLWTPKLSAGGWALLAVAALLAGYIGLLEYSRPHVSGDPLALDRFLDLTERDRIESARILDVDAYVVGSYVAPGGAVRPYNTPYFKSEVLRDNLADVLIPNGVPTTVDQQQGKRVITPISVLIPALILVIVFLYFIFSFRSGTGLFNVSSGARKIEPQEGDVTFADVAGQDEAVTELREISEFLSRPERFAAMGSRMPKGILLFGPPGCGKTLVARALAGESGASFYSISGSDFVEMYVGVGASRVRELFNEARENAPAIVFIDELDSVAGRRGTGGGAPTTGSGSEQEQALNQILAEMDGFSPTEGIMLVGATNRPDTLDPALLRPGRFDRSIGLELPDQQGRQAILAVHARGRPLDPESDLEAIAERAVGTTGADLASVINEAGMLAGRADMKTISQADLERALERILEAPERQRRLSMRERSVGQRTLAEDRVTFAQVAGADEAIEELREVRDYLGAPERFAEMGARIPRGYLLSGPPGCGKTLLARAVAGESNAAFVAVSGSDFVQRYVGEGAGRVRDLFAEARSIAPAILFIDEIDAVGAARGSLGSDDSDRHQTLNQILVELDGFSPRAGVVVMAATNRPDILDPALVRPGRFDRQVVMELPDVDARRGILDVHAAGKPIGPDVDLDAVARLTRGMAGADLAGVMNEAALLAARRGVGRITTELLEEAVERAYLGIGGARKMTDEDRRAVAYHEAGHGLVAMALPGGRVLHRLSIIPRAGSLGTAWLPESDEHYTRSRSLLIERMATLLGGRTAEELVFGEPRDGASTDLATVADLARRMVAQLGMSNAVGAINHDSQHGPDGRHVHSDETARLIDSEVRRLVDEAGELARDVLADSRELLDRVVAELLQRETLTLKEVEEIAATQPTSGMRP